MGRIDSFLKDRQKKDLLRSLRPATGRSDGRIFFNDRGLVDFSSNDYLGLSNHPRLKAASHKALEDFGTGSSASRLLSGSLDIHHELEKRIASFKGKEAALVFNSGYQANTGIISSLCGRGDVIFCDRLSHASIIDGMLLSQARFIRFEHNDMEDLKFFLERERANYREALIITETVFSMDGDVAPLGELVRLKDLYNCKLMVDEAHAMGIFGPNGSGQVEAEGLAERVDLIMGTFSKAMGSFGAYIASSKETIEYLVNACRSFIYSTALPPAVIAANIESLNLVKDEPQRRELLLLNADYLREALKGIGLNVRGASQICPLIVGANSRAIELSNRLMERGYWALPIRTPTVPEGEARLRFSLTYGHTIDVLKGLVNDIRSIYKV